MSTRNLEKIFNPESIALIGASEKKGSVGYGLFKNLLDGGFRERVYGFYLTERGTLYLHYGLGGQRESRF